MTSTLRCALKRLRADAAALRQHPAAQLRGERGAVGRDHVGCQQRRALHPDRQGKIISHVQNPMINVEPCHAALTGRAMLCHAPRM